VPVCVGSTHNVSYSISGKRGDIPCKNSPAVKKGEAKIAQVTADKVSGS